MEILFIILIVLASFGLIFFWIMTAINIACTKFETTLEKVIWLLVVLCFPVFGTILYYIANPSRRYRVLANKRKLITESEYV